MNTKQNIMEHLKELTGEQDSELLLSLYTEYRRSVLEKMTLMKEALPTADFGVLYNYSHALKGMSEISGFQEMWEHAANFVAATKAEDIATCKAEYEKMAELSLTLEE